ncbi:MAG: hypothetical protein Q4F47_08530 [Bacteroidaceae bacterium]|nr:hypothetical protein [Bacteroidaceae bacterium]MDO5483067.1 hypothetical protein [Bacteroidaceae bacterium]
MLKVAVSVSCFMTLFFFASCRESIHERFEREAREYTEQNCPRSMGDGITMIDSMVYVQNMPNGEWAIHYSVFLDEEQKKELMSKKDELERLNLKFVQNSPIFIKQKEAGIDFAFIYHDALTKKKFLECRYTKKDYE